MQHQIKQRKEKWWDRK